MNACRTFGKALAIVPRGGTIYVGSGDYSQLVALTRPSSGDNPITIKRATPADPGIGAGWNDSYGIGPATIIGSVLITTNDWIIDGVTGGGADHPLDGHGFRIRGKAGENNSGKLISSRGVISNVQLSHIDCDGSRELSESSVGQIGMAFDGESGECRNILVSYCKIHDTQGYLVRGRLTNSTFEHNAFYNNGNSPLYHGASIGLYGHSWNNAIRYNMFFQAEGDCIKYDPTDWTDQTLEIYSNIFDSTFSDIPNLRPWRIDRSVISAMSGHVLKGCKLINNTFSSIESPLLAQPDPNGKINEQNSGNEARNNIFANYRQLSFATFTHDHNYFVGPEGTFNEPNGIAGIGYPFTGGASGDFRPKAQVPRGQNLGQSYESRDLYGRVRGASWTRGAIEMGAAPQRIEGLRISRES